MARLCSIARHRLAVAAVCPARRAAGLTRVGAAVARQRLRAAADPDARQKAPGFARPVPGRHMRPRPGAASRGAAACAPASHRPARGARP